MSRTQVTKVEPKTAVKSEPVESVERPDSTNCIDEENSDRTISLLGSISATENGNIMRRKRKRKVITEELQDKLKQEEV